MEFISIKPSETSNILKKRIPINKSVATSKVRTSSEIIKAVQVPITIGNETTQVKLEILISGVPDELKDSLKLFVRQRGNFKNVKKSKRRGLDHGRNKRLLLIMNKKINEDSEDKIKQLHSDIVSVKLSDRGKKGWCFLYFPSEEKAKSAYEELKDNKDYKILLYHPSSDNAVKPVTKQPKTVKKKKLAAKSWL